MYYLFRLVVDSAIGGSRFKESGGRWRWWQWVAEGGCGSGWLCSGMQWLMGPMERSKMSEGRKREYCERESETKRERAHEIPKWKSEREKILGKFCERERVRGKKFWVVHFKSITLGSALFFIFTVYFMSYCDRNYIYLWHSVCHNRPYIMRDLHCLLLNTIVWQLLCFVTISFFILLIKFIGADLIICELTKLLILIKVTLFMRITNIPLNLKND